MASLTSKFTGGTQLLVSSSWYPLLSAFASISDSSPRMIPPPEADSMYAAYYLLFHSPSLPSGISATSNTSTNMTLFTLEQMLLDTLPQQRKHSWFGSFSWPLSLTSPTPISCALHQLTAKPWMEVNQKDSRLICHLPHSEHTKRRLSEWLDLNDFSAHHHASALQNWQWLCVGWSHIDIFRIYFRFTPRELIIII